MKKQIVSIMEECGQLINPREDISTSEAKEIIRFSLTKMEIVGNSYLYGYIKGRRYGNGKMVPVYNLRQMTDDEWKIVQMNGNWSFLTEKHLLMVKFGKEEINNLIIFAGHDWENETETILFTGLDSQGRSVWGKRIK